MADFHTDVQGLRAKHPYRLTRVGVTGVRKPVVVERPNREATVTLTPSIDAFVDLPPEQRGVHMSRNVEAINETLDRAVREPAGSLEEVAERIVRELLARHDYASEAEVTMESDYFLDRRTPSGARTTEVYELVAGARAQRDGGAWRTIGVGVAGMNACPCAMQESRRIYASREGALGAWAASGEGPFISHNQRVRTLLLVTTPDGAEVEADDLIDLVESAFSSPTYEFLKRGDEARVVVRAHENPKFVEDIVREVLDAVRTKFDALPDDTEVAVRTEAEESIHKHNATAERVTTLGELRHGA